MSVFLVGMAPRTHTLVIFLPRVVWANANLWDSLGQNSLCPNIGIDWYRMQLHVVLDRMRIMHCMCTCVVCVCGIHSVIYASNGLFLYIWRAYESDESGRTDSCSERALGANYLSICCVMIKYLPFASELVDCTGPGQAFRVSRHQTILGNKVVFRIRFNNSYLFNAVVHNNIVW